MKGGDLCMSRNTYYWTCPYCGANLDPGEKCDCNEGKEEPPKILVDNYKSVQGGGETQCVCQEKTWLKILFAWMTSRDI